MKVIQFIKQLNNTELGKSGTNDTYVLVPNEVDITGIFEEPNVAISFVDIDSSEEIAIRHTVGREKRIVGLGPYYRSKNLSAGDEIVFEKRTIGETESFLVRTHVRNDIVVFRKGKNGFEILTPERLPLAEQWSADSNGTFAISFLEAAKKRNDSPDVTNYYNIVLDGKSLTEIYVGNDAGIITRRNGNIEVQNFYGWKQYEFEMEE